MEVPEFKRILEIGLGRAIRFLQTNDAAPYHDVILDACLHDTRYDHQVEDRRSVYLFDIIKHTTAQAFFRERIIQVLREASEPNAYDTLQINGLAARWAEQGDQEARQLVYDNFVAYLTSDERGDVTRMYDLIYLDDTEGFLFAVEHLGKLLSEGSDYEPLHWFPLREEDWDTDERTYWDAATQRAADNPHVAAYVAFERNRRTRRKTGNGPRIPLSSLSYDQLKQKITSYPGGYGLAMWGKHANETDLERAAADLLTLDRQNDVVLLRKYLAIFRERGFPLDPQKLIELASEARNGPIYDENDYLTPPSRLVLAALNALEHVTHPEVRQLTFELIEGRQWIWNTVGLLTSNWQDSDWLVLEALARETFEPYEYHGLGMDIRKIFDAHPDPGAAQTLINLYEYGPCSACRERYVRALDSIHAVPDWLREECRYDANLDLREWVNAT